MIKHSLIKPLSFLILLTIATAAKADEAKKMTIFKTPWCGCCQVWSDAMEQAGFKVSIKHMDDLSPIRKQAGIKEEFAGCHTAIVDGYVLEGHVPLQAVNKLMSERPKIRGLAVPGMPQGSLGMGYDPNARYDVLAIHGRNRKPDIYYQAGKTK